MIMMEMVIINDADDNDGDGDEPTSPWMTPSSPARPKPKSFRCFNVNLMIMIMVVFWLFPPVRLDMMTIHNDKKWSVTFYGQSSIARQRRWSPRNDFFKLL